MPSGTKQGIVLLTGFEPFNQQTVNPAALAVEALAHREILGRRVVAKILPVTFADALSVLLRTLRAVRPELVICVGEAGGRAEITVERVAINIDDARIPDNAGAQPVDRPIVARGPVAYWSTLPIKSIVAALQKRGIPAAVSQTAGTFVCNHVFYGLMHALATERGVRGGFIHVPMLPDQVAKLPVPTPSMPIALMTLALETAIETALRTRRDVRAAGGATH